MRRSLKFATLAALIGSLLVSPSVASANVRNKLVVFGRYRITVPASWPVYNLAANPSVCVRFNRHAVYLGSASSGQRCAASDAVGRTEAIWIAPLAAHSAQSGGAVASGLPPAPGAKAGTESSSELVLPARGVVVTATWGTHPATVEKALGVRLLPGYSPAASAAGATPGTGSGGPTAHAAGVSRGLGFDACSAPSTGAMSAWKASPFKSVGIYIGGTNMGCSQPNLSASWVTRESAAGWGLIPTYVGLQAPGNSCGCASITSSQASAQGAAAAGNAITDAQALSIGKGNPIYYDMEAYSPGGSATSAVRAFLTTWTNTLHARGYLSGVYSSGNSGIADLVRAYGTGFLEPDDIWIADWNGAETTSDPYVPSGDWGGDQRIHQYSGAHNDTYGGVTLSIDSNSVDAATAGAGQVYPDGTFVQEAGSPAIYRIAGGAPVFVSDWTTVGGPQAVKTLTAQQFASLNSVPASGTFLATEAGAIYRVAGGAPLAVSSWALYAGVQPSVTIDPWDIANITNPLAHLNSKPANGTIVEGLPSGTYWSFNNGNRFAAQPSPLAIGIDDASLSAFPIIDAPTGGAASVPHCVVPTLKQLTLHNAVGRLRKADCKLGKVAWPAHFPPPNHPLHVNAQSTRAGTKHPVGYRVGVTLR
jgi:Domain of unknown function (DUF1906)